MININKKALTILIVKAIELILAIVFLAIGQWANVNVFALGLLWSCGGALFFYTLIWFIMRLLKENADWLLNFAWTVIIAGLAAVTIVFCFVNPHYSADEYKIAPAALLIVTLVVVLLDMILTIVWYLIEFE